MVREAYRNYRHSNYLTYLFAARDFTDAARRIALLREVAAARPQDGADRGAHRGGEARTRAARQPQAVARLGVALARRPAQKLQNDAAAAVARSTRSRRRKTALQRKLAQEEQLDAAIAALRKLTKGNKEGASFSAGTSGLRLPVAGAA